MKNIVSLLFLLIVSSLIGFSTFYLSLNYFVRDIGYFNSISIKFAYLKLDGDFVIHGYDSTNEKKIDTTKYITVEYGKKDGTDAVGVYEYSIQVPYLSSHSLRFVFNGIHNIVYIQSLSINGKNIDTANFYNKFETNERFRIGTSSKQDGLFIELLAPSVEFDVTNIYDPIALTEDEIKQYADDYIFLRNFYLIFNVSIIFLILFFVSKKTKILLDNAERSTEVGNNKRRMFIFASFLLASCLSIHTSYFILLDDSFWLDSQPIVQSSVSIDGSNVNVSSRADNILLFEQNIIPVLVILVLSLLFLSFCKKRYLRIILSLIPICLTFILLVDNCLLNVLGTRLNFKFGDDYLEDTKYFTDFILKYILSYSGFFMCASFVIITILVLWTTIYKRVIFPTKLYLILCILSVSVFIWGVIPSELRDANFRFANVFQINGYCFQKFGNFMKFYTEEYEPRDSLAFNWNKKEGLNNKQNVILILVESFGCNFTYICGAGPSYMPKIEKLAENNLFFDNYYSILPSTSISYLSIVKGLPSIQSVKKNATSLTNNYAFELYKHNDLIQKFSENGYETKFISSIDYVFGMKESVGLSNYSEEIDANSNVFKSIKDRYVFNGVSDEELFKYILESVKTSDPTKRFFYVTATTSNHSPYTTPIAFNNMKKAFEYTDSVVSDFIEKLKKENYFDNGIVVLVGDHHAWSNDSLTDVSHPTLINKVPLIIIDGKNHGERNHTEFSHASLGPLLQYIELPEYTYNQFNVNPLDNNEGKSEIIFGYDYQKFSLLAVKKGSKEAYVMLSGNDSEFLNKNIFTPEEEKEILGFIAWFRH